MCVCVCVCRAVRGKDLLPEEEIVGLAVVETAGCRRDAQHLPAAVKKELVKTGQIRLNWSRWSRV
jgi:hypothetical protein